MKLGGGLITNKDLLCSVNLDVIDRIASVISKVNKRLIIVHGAGSFGHLKAKEFELAKGRIKGMNQDDAIKDVRSDMLELNSHVMDALERNGISAEAFPPHTWASGLGVDFSGNLPYSEGVTVVFGDVVLDPNQGFGILSGDDLVVRYALETPDVEHLIFAVAGVDGLLRVPPNIAGPDDLIEEWSPDVEYIAEHQSSIDVTGGIGLKASRGSIVAEAGIKVSIVSGEHPERIFNAIEGKSTIGTSIVSRNT